MNTAKDHSGTPATGKQSLRILPGIIIVIIQWLLRFVLPQLFPGDGIVVAGVAAAVLGLVAVLVWWAFFSRAPVKERWIGVILIIAALLLSSRFLDKSIFTGNMGLMFIIVSTPVMSLFFVVWAVISRYLPNSLRMGTMILTITCAAGLWLFVRSDGMTGHLQYDFKWRWARSHEDQMLPMDLEKPEPAILSTGNGIEWPGFRGPARDGIVHGISIKTDWKSSPPDELWHRAIGPGASSFAVSGDLVFTQEQRGDYEEVTCYRLETGKPVWEHKDKARFWDSHTGAGPRATPTFAGGRLYTFGATGILNALNASDGSIIWSHNAADDTGGKDTGWGFTSSPLVTDSLVLIAASGNIAAYDLISGELRWKGPDTCKGYSSPQLLEIDGILQVLLNTDLGVRSYNLSDGKILWESRWQSQDRILQPAQSEDGDIYLCSASSGIRRLSVTHSGDSWNTIEKWTSQGLRPYFNDMVVHKGYGYGFDGLALGCINLENGTRMWRGGRYGGQILLFADQDLLVVVTEKGDLALVSASPGAYRELAHVKGINGRTWNHPALAGSVLLVRNSDEMAAFRLPVEEKN